jgi:Glycosyl hydrolase catalytic core
MPGASRRAITSAVAAVAALAVALSLATSAAAAPPRTFYSVAPQTELTAQDYSLMGQGKVGMLRIMINWPAVQPLGPGSFDWSSVDGTVAEAARNGVEVLPFLYGTPTWVATGLDGFSCGDCVAYAPKGPAAQDAWAAFVGAAVDRYGPNGSLWAENPDLPKVPIDVWQIWNEQNSPSFYKPKPKVKPYAKLLAASATAIRSRDPGADVLLGGMAGLPGVKKATTAWDYLGKLYDRKGAKKNFDGVAPHPYGAKMKKVIEQIDLIRKEIKRGRDKNVDMWVTEIGWGSAKGGNPLNRGPKGQATRLKEAYKYFRKRRNKLNVETVTWFSFKDAPSAICKWCPSSGLFNQALAPKRSWAAFTKLTGGS